MAKKAKKIINCRPGDLAIYVSGVNLGAIVRVECAFHGDGWLDGFHWITEPGVEGPVWVVSTMGGMLSAWLTDGNVRKGMYRVCAAPDSILRALRDDDGDDQSLSWVDRPPAETLFPQEVCHGPCP